VNFHRQVQIWLVKIQCVSETVAWLINQQVGLECRRVAHEEYPSKLDHAQSEDQFGYASFLSGEPD